VSNVTRAESPEAATGELWDLCLYVTNRTPRSVIALTNLRKICEEHLAGHYRIEVVDLLKQPQRAASDQIVAIPTLVRKLPATFRRVIGDLSNTQRVLAALGLHGT
jgi:circadian clock protein KaiB